MRAATEITRLADQAIRNANLSRNAAKGHWGDIPTPRLWWLFAVELWELVRAVWMLAAARRRYRRAWRTSRRLVSPYEWSEMSADMRTEIAKARAHVMYEAGDCVCFLAFIVDRV